MKTYFTNPYESMSFDYLTIIFFTILFIGVIWLLLREARCWYFKINRRVELLESINKNLGILVEEKNYERDLK
ncbi:MAG: hypothetical protein H0S78_00430 [Tissierellales bacterium]|nr:hypothetical protein [Tissierellales bacterium]